MTSDTIGTPELWTPGGRLNPDYSELIGLPDSAFDLTQEELKNYWPAVMSVTHGNEQDWDVIVKRRQQQFRNDGLLPIRANPKAAELDERSIDENLVLCYGRPQRPNNTHETNVAQALERVFGAMHRKSIKIDGHNGSADFFVINPIAPPEVHIAERELGFRNVIVRENVPFLRHVAGSMIAEIMSNGADSTGLRKQQQAERFDKGLDRIVELGRRGLRELFFAEGTEGMDYYAHAAEIGLLNPDDGTPNTDVIEVISELEGLSAGEEPFSKLPLSDNHAKRLKLDPRVDYYWVYWGESNSERMPSGTPGLSADKEYPIWFGDLVTKIDHSPVFREKDGLIYDMS